MRVLVQKYGGSLVGSGEALRLVATRIAEAHREARVAVIVSAMGDTTDELIRRARSVARQPAARELDMLISTGEVVAASLLAMTLRDIGCPAVALTGAQAGIRTDGVHLQATIGEVDVGRVRAALESGSVAVIAGFQGVTEAGDITTLGRGGSDTSAVAIAAALAVERCDIFKEVDGVFTADPRVVPTARRVDRLCYREMFELARHGGTVLHERAVELAGRCGLWVRVRAAFGGDGQTDVLEDAPSTPYPIGIASRTDVAHLVFEGDSSDSRRLARSIESCEVLRGRPRGRFEAIVSLREMPSPTSWLEQLGADFGPALEARQPAGLLGVIGGGSERLMGEACAILHDRGIPALGLCASQAAVSLLVPPDVLEDATRLLHRTLIEEALPAAAANEAVS